MVISPGDKLHIIARRLFDGDLRRHFVGMVEAAAGTLVRVRGYAFVYDQAANDFIRREEQRVRVFGLDDAANIVNVLPESVCLDDVRYETDGINRRMLTDGSAFSMNISEFGAMR